MEKILCDAFQLSKRLPQTSESEKIILLDETCHLGYFRFRHSFIHQ